MIIRKINIIAFGGVKNISIELNKGLNIIYGENEVGKSTIQSFIKVWLYGFNNYRGKDYKNNERVKYSPIDGEKISGELYVEFEEKQYIIRRTFGKTKKEDTSYIIDAISGEEVEYISKSEPGKSFLGVNRSTFINTLFIGQLAVDVKKDREEEIIDKISNSVSSSEGQVSIDLAFSRLEAYKKSISNNRRSGKLDILKEKFNNLITERYEAYKLSNNNLENEEKLIKLKEEKNSLNKELNNLDIYKKYLKKIKLQKEYEDISEYFIKKQELKNKERFISEELTVNDSIISERLVKDIREEYHMYINLLDIKNDEEQILNEKEEKLSILKEPVNKYKYINEFPENILSILERLKLRRETLREKVDINKNIKNELEFLKAKKYKNSLLIDDTYKIGEVRVELDKLLNEYEDKLKTLKHLLEENNKISSNNRIFKVLLAIMVLILIVTGIIIKTSILSNTLYLISFSIIIGYLINYIKSSRKIKRLKKDVNNIEKQLDVLVKKLNVKDHKELFKLARIYDEYLKEKQILENKIEERISQSKLLSLDKAVEDYEKNEFELSKYLSKSRVNSLEELICEIEEYKIISTSFISLEIEIKNIKSTLEKNCKHILIREENLRKRLSLIGLSNIRFVDLEDALNELDRKLKLRDEINKNLLSVEVAYSTLTKDKDIDLIKEELKDLIDISINYTYENEEEVDSILKNKNIRLVEVEKEIKDVENEINNRFIGKRNIPEIEEDIQNTEMEIIALEKLLKASNLTKDILSEAYDEIRQGFGPILNEKVISSFKCFTDEKYKQVMVSDNYEMKLLTKEGILSGDILSNGANDQLYLSLRLAIIEMIFKNKNIPLCLDDAFVQYDDNRIKKAMLYIIEEGFTQYIIFTCQNREIDIINKNNIKANYIELLRE